MCKQFGTVPCSLKTKPSSAHLFARRQNFLTVPTIQLIAHGALLQVVTAEILVAPLAAEERFVFGVGRLVAVGISVGVVVTGLAGLAGNVPAAAGTTTTIYGRRILVGRERETKVETIQCDRLILT